MDPFKMPRAFCITQAILMDVATYELVGLSTAFCVATSLHILKPKKWGTASAAFKWRPLYIIPVVIYPALLSAIQITLIFTYNAVQPSDDMHCDATNPLWIRLTGHALPLTSVIPFLVMAIRSCARVRRTLAHVQRAQRDDNELPRKIRRDRLSFKPEPVAEPRSSMASSSFPTFAPMPVLKSPPPVDADFVGEGSSAPTSNADHGDSELELDVTIQVLKDEEDMDDGGTYRLSYRETATPSSAPSFPLSSHLPQSRPGISHIANVPTYSSTICFLLCCQFLAPLFVFIQSLSAIIDVAAKRQTPTPFGTHHVSILASAWGPTVLSMSLRSVRQTIWHSYVPRWIRRLRE
ncbi:hypothetical protein C8F01DRAFT_1151443 [Mycena amicta]|nr:hypothetical protein C8F01DRAFT_1151443 [Mycena amicta]